MAQLVCHLCGEPVPYEEPIPRESTCPKCGTDLRCCRNCRHWDPKYNNECTEPMAEREADKLRRNFCEYFYYSREPYSGRPGGAADRAADARAKLEALFGEGKARPATGTSATPPGGGAAPSTPAAGKSSRAEDAKAKLEKLFGKKDEGE